MICSLRIEVLTTYRLNCYTAAWISRCIVSRIRILLTLCIRNRCVNRKYNSWYLWECTKCFRASWAGCLQCFKELFTCYCYNRDCVAKWEYCIELIHRDIASFYSCSDTATILNSTINRVVKIIICYVSLCCILICISSEITQVSLLCTYTGSSAAIQCI